MSHFENLIEKICLLENLEFPVYCADNCLGESARGISDQIIDHDGRDQKSHPFRHAVVNHHRNASYDDFKIIGGGFRNNAFKRKVAEALLIKDL